MDKEKEIFQKGSTTYYFSSRLFPKKIRENVFKLYSFVRTADDYVDNIPPHPKKLLALEKSYNAAIVDHTFDATAHQWDEIDVRVVKHIVRLQQLYKFDETWVKGFFASMKMDIEPKAYKTLDDSLVYVHGSAEVIGLMMAKIMKLPEEALEAAKLQGRAMQWINFIRDIDEDNKLGRNYFPLEDLKKFDLKNLTEEEARAKPDNYKKFVQKQLDLYKKWQKEADKGMHYIPERLQVAVKTAVDMYNWTAREIEKDPFVVFEKKVKPRKRRVAAHAVNHAARGSARVAVRTAKQIKAGSKKAVPAAKAAVPIVTEKAKEKATDTADSLILKTDELREKLPGSKE